MSNLNSVFDVQAGIPPNGFSSLQYEFKQKNAESPTLTEGKVVKIENETGVAVATALTSARIQTATLEFNLPDVPWLVIQGADQGDAIASGKMVCLQLKTGLIFKVSTGVAWTIGDKVAATSGALSAITAGVNVIGGGVEAAKAEQAFGLVLDYSAGSGYVVVAS